MSRTIDYYFSTLSPWTYIGHDLFQEIVRRHALRVDYKPVPIGKVFAQTGGQPLPERPAPRRRYRMVELQRWRDKRGLSFDVSPPHWPFAAERLDRAVIALARRGVDPDAFLRRAFEGIWEERRDLGDADVIAATAEEAGLDGHALLAEADAPETEALYALNHETAIAADVFGAPSYVFDGEVFWGQDRLELLDDALRSGRPPYRPPPRA